MTIPGKPIEVRTTVVNPPAVTIGEALQPLMERWARRSAKAAHVRELLPETRKALAHELCSALREHGLDAELCGDRVVVGSNALVVCWDRKTRSLLIQERSV